MPAKLIDGNKISEKYLADVRKYVAEHRIKPKLVTILVGDDPASLTYVNIKKKTCESVGISVDIHKTTPDEIIIKNLIRKLNEDNTVSGILVQLPLPKDLDTKKVMELIDPSKDVDGLHPLNLGRLAYGDETMPACTPYGIIRLLEDEKIEIEGSCVAIVGRSIHVGKPLYSLLYNRNATVTMCHTKTKDLEKITRNADIVVVAVGVANYLTDDMVKDGSVIIDVGVNKIGKKLVGDADFSVREKASAVTPVPGGVGPMTVAMLARNTLNAYISQHNPKE